MDCLLTHPHSSSVFFRLGVFLLSRPARKILHVGSMVELSLLCNCDRFMTRKHASLDKKIGITETLSIYHIAMQSSSIRAPHLLVSIIFVYIFIMLCLVKSAEKFQKSQTFSLDHLAKEDQTHYRVYRYSQNVLNAAVTMPRQNLTLRSSPDGVRTNTSCPSLTGSGRKQVNSSTNITSHHPKLLSCTDISNLTLKRILGKGADKNAYLSTYKGKDVVVKMISNETFHVKHCRKYFTKEECFLQVNYKLMKEIMLSLQLDHRNILKVKVYKIKIQSIDLSEDVLFSRVRGSIIWFHNRG